MSFFCRDCDSLHTCFKWQLKTAFKQRCTKCGGPLLSVREARDAKPASTPKQGTKIGSAIVGLQKSTPSIEEPSGYESTGLQKADQMHSSAMQSEM